MKSFAAALLCVSYTEATKLQASTGITTGATAEVEAEIFNRGLGKKGVFGGIGGRLQGEYSSEGPTDYGSTDSHSYDSYLTDFPDSDYISSDAGSDNGLPTNRILNPRDHYFNETPKKHYPKSDAVYNRTPESLTIFDNAYEELYGNQYDYEGGNFYRGGHPSFGDAGVNPYIGGHGGLIGLARFGRSIGPDGYYHGNHLGEQLLY